MRYDKRFAADFQNSTIVFKVSRSGVER